MTLELWVSKIGDWFVPITETGCWVWMRSDNGHYGNLWVDGKLKYAHRIAWSLYNGAIPDNLVIDHMCRNTLCVNPDHLRVVTVRENVMASNAPPSLNARKTHCPKGHALEGSNLLMEGHKRKCRECHNARRRKANQ